ncbi:hypothetical protein ZOD2009_13296 [Haladaptatus paucihalophilus DX253]|uniref:Uncharacterized conserved protein, DUF302 family n=1 Tax=Haladaptatus paucihalophilus DX253 TaxID=797209 RepID=E7QV23_HALPU|nr:DUF302 domain-containing protein [Haladaptatus paucihalophilus]EFW91541.1 hypothetical protein ZOD2009_13296 [Haladaptatus paucihalophilus DX253]SHL25206.1 Uncharacterized conserved protein, DUF302 family [Haladaptatus paucihalophilus DX253]
MTYYDKRHVEGEFDAVVERTTEALGDEGFGVLSDIDVSDAFAKKLDIEDYPNYRILGACNPPLAKQGLDAEEDLGVLLPCNVAVYETDEGVVVSMVDPEAMLSVVDNAEMDDIADEVQARFDRVLESLGEE